jgi:RNA polymerase sigma-70 factor (ECF subfamily)
MPVAKTSDEVLLARAREGDESAFNELLERHRDALRRFAETRLPPRLRRRVSVADVLQEASLVAHRRHASFEPRGPDSFRNWLMGIVDRKVREAIRGHEGAARRSLQREVTRAQRAQMAQMPAGTPTPSQIAVGAETAALADRILEEMREDDRTVLRLTRHERLTLQETAVRMNRSREATRKLLGRALARFSERFEEALRIANGP